MYTLLHLNSPEESFYHFGITYSHYLYFCKEIMNPLLANKVPQTLTIATSPFKGSKRAKIWKRQINCLNGNFFLDMITIAQGDFAVIDPCFSTLSHFFPGKTTLYFRFNY